MSEINNAFEGTVLTSEEVQQDLAAMVEYYKDMILESQILNQGLPIPMVLAVMEEDEKGRPRSVVNSFVPLDRESARFTKYIQYYCELADEVENIPREDLYQVMNVLNARLPAGSCILVEPRPEMNLPLKMGVRLIQGFPVRMPLDQGVFTETLFLFDQSCSFVSYVLDALAEGKTPAEALAVIGA